MITMQPAGAAFASTADVEPKRITFEQLSAHAWAYTAEGDPNSGVIIGKDSCVVIDATATPLLARDLIARIRAITDKPIKHVVLTHYHAVRVLGASAYSGEGATEIIASRATRELIVERGQADMDSEIGRFPRLFAGAETIPGLTWPTLTFERSMTLHLGDLEVQVQQPGMGHTRGDTIVWLPEEKVLFSGDLVEFESAAYTGDAHLGAWPETLRKLRALGPEKLVPGRGRALGTAAEAQKAIDYTARFISALYDTAVSAVRDGADLKETMRRVRARMDPEFSHVFIYEHCLPFDVSRAFDEAHGVEHPVIWTAERDRAMWEALR
ncbi:MBL fold metallo-hydrolase [Pendulispora albinea]|uniref:MBL fold metallo-hydrolase n=1 Tax=Pendulispora albinea TaxID=2741071 RepID=A0ABZ2LRS1_9BACT